VNTRIILVEDHDNVRRALSRALTTVGFSVRSFACAEEFLEIPSAQIEADCLLIDAHLPGISGLQLCRDLRERSVQVPVVCISSDADDCVATAVLDSGAVAFLLKPFDMASLLDVLDRVVPSSRRA
jgi:FixJ family two-component response regulator